MNKKDNWHRLTKQFKATTDALGQPLDPRIFEAVIALNALGFETTASCEGHTEGSYAPYIDIAVNTPANEKERAIEALQLAESDEELRAANDLVEQCNVHYLAIRHRLIALLTDFYTDRHVPYGQLLTPQSREVFGFVEELRLQCTGTENLDITDAAERAVKLKAYQGEIQAFAVFLKERYFEE